MLSKHSSRRSSKVSQGDDFDGEPFVEASDLARKIKEDNDRVLKVEQASVIACLSPVERASLERWVENNATVYYTERRFTLTDPDTKNEGDERAGSSFSRKLSISGDQGEQLQENFY